MRGAYLEVMGDLVGSGAVIVAAIVIATTGWLQADVAGVGVHRDPHPAPDLGAAQGGGRRAAGGVAQGDRPGRACGRTSWRPGRRRRPRSPRLDDHLGRERRVGARGAGAGASPPAVLDYLCGCLSGDFDIEHSTFQLETADRRRLGERPPRLSSRTRRGTGRSSRLGQAAPVPGLKTMSAMMIAKLTSSSRETRKTRPSSARAAGEVGPSVSNSSATFFVRGPM